MFNSIINSHKNVKTRKKSSNKKNRKAMSPNTYSKFRNTFLSIYDYNSPTTATGSSKSGMGTTTNATLQKLLSDKKKKKKAG
jgi:hypothetical protein